MTNISPETETMAQTVHPEGVTRITTSMNNFGLRLGAESTKQTGYHVPSFVGSRGGINSCIALTSHGSHMRSVSLSCVANVAVFREVWEGTSLLFA